MWSSWEGPGAKPPADEAVPRSTAAMIGGALAEAPGPYVSSTRYRYSPSTPQYAGLTSPGELVRREENAQAAVAQIVARNSLAAFTPRMALADMRAAAMSLGGGDGGGDGESSPLRGLAVWCLLGALVVASMRW